MTGHRVVIVATPEDRRKPLCSCGWQGIRHEAKADAELEAAEHRAEKAILRAMRKARP